MTPIPDAGGGVVMGSRVERVSPWSAPSASVRVRVQALVLFGATLGLGFLGQLQRPIEGVLACWL
jgi:hypothetical protein